MEIFYSSDFTGGFCTLPEDESAHCVKVLRHREGDEIFVMDGQGSLFTCRLTDASARAAQAKVEKEEKGWGSHPYFLQMAVCPTKNNDRFEWFAEKATEVGLDVISPVIGEHSERKVFKTDRLRRILLSACKQSLKAALPQVEEPVSVKDFILSAPDDALKLICCCFEGKVPRTSVNEALGSVSENSKIIVLIGPEGDFSHDEAEMAIDHGFVPVHLGASRLRTETAALTAVEAVYLKCI